MTQVGDELEASNSEVQTFMDCKRKWWLSYYRRLKPAYEAPVGPLAIGNRVHKVLEEGYSTPGRETAALAVLAETIEHDYPLAEELGPEVLKKFESEAELALIMVQGFMEWAAEEGFDAGWEVIAHERIVRTPPMLIRGVPVVIKGKLDQTIRREMDGAVMFRDWKTTQTMSPVLLAFGPQIKMYTLLLSLTEPEAQVSGAFLVFLKKVKRTAAAKPPFYKSEPFYVSSTQMENFFISLVGTLEKMVELTQQLDAGGDPMRLAPARPTRDCSWRCPFYKCCDMFDDGSNVEAYLSSNYEAGDPYAYYEEDQQKGDAGQ